MHNSQSPRNGQLEVLLVAAHQTRRAAAHPHPTPADGPPPGYRDGDLDGDFYQTPYGLFSLGAQALAAGHQVKLLNLSAYPWSEVERVLASLDADLFGMSCWTANRRGVALAARRMQPNTGATCHSPDGKKP